MKILIADSFPESHRVRLTDDGHSVTFDPALDGTTLAGAIDDHEILIVRSTAVSAETLEAGKNLKLVIRAGAGTNTIDKPSASELNIRVCNVPGANAAAVAELALGLMLSIDRNIPANVADLKQGVWNKKKYASARGLLSQKLGILGLGAIGMAVAERARAFGMPVYAVKKAGRSESVEQKIADAGITQLESIDALLAECDIVTLHMPAGADTKNLVNRDFLDKMKPGAMLINTSRGELVDEAALIDAMNEKGIRAGLDVYQNEPGSGDKEFVSAVAAHENVCGTHHIGASTDQAQVAVADGALEIIAAYASNGEFRNCVNDA
jgi:D-3-phosphoglycerate dehydrogenase